MDNNYYIFIKRSSFLFLFTEKELVQKFKAQEVDMMLRKHIQRQNTQLLDKITVIPLIPVTSPSTRKRRVKPGKVFSDRPITPTVDNTNALQLLEDERNRLLQASTTAEDTKQKLQQELRKALSRRNTSNPSVSTKGHSTSKQRSTKRHSSPKVSTKRHSIPPVHALPRSSATVSRAPPSPVIQEVTDSVDNEEIAIDLTQNTKVVIDSVIHSEDNEQHESPVARTRKRKYTKFQADSNNNSCSDEELDEASVQQRIKVFKPTVSHVHSQQLDMSRSSYYDSLIDDMIESQSIDKTTECDTDCMGRVRLPISQQGSASKQHISDMYKAKLSKPGGVRSMPDQPIFYNRYATATDRVLSEVNSDKPFYQGATEVPDEFCLLLKEDTPSLAEIDSGNLKLPIQDVKDVEGSLSYAHRSLDMINRGIQFNETVTANILGMIGTMVPVLEGAPNQFVDGLNIIKINAAAQSASFLELQIAVESTLDHLSYSQSVLEINRRAKLLNQVKFKNSITPADKRTLKASPLCSENLIDPQAAVDILHKARKLKDGGYPGHKFNESSAVQHTPASKVAEKCSLVDSCSIDESAPTSTSPLRPAAREPPAATLSAPEGGSDRSFSPGGDDGSNQ